MTSKCARKVQVLMNRYDELSRLEGELIMFSPRIEFSCDITDCLKEDLKEIIRQKKEEIKKELEEIV